MIVIIVGPSGSGKTALVGQLLTSTEGTDNPIHLLPSYTTAQPRADHIARDGVGGTEYVYISDSVMDETPDAFIWTTEPEGHHARYGTKYKDLEVAREKTVIAILTPDKAQVLFDWCLEERIACFPFFLIPPSERELLKRLRRRNMSNAMERVKKTLPWVDEIQEQEMSCAFIPPSPTKWRVSHQIRARANLILHIVDKGLMPIALSTYKTARDCDKKELYAPFRT